ncbi:MAG: RtcB family protein [Anaerolineales bacterium]|nr:RtcB family protein [Anaerolineales bacterium]
MRVPVRIFATRDLLEQVLHDRSLEQAINTATLPGLVGAVVVMPDMHQGYGFPIGGVAATEFPQGVISPGGVGYDINCLTGETRILHSHGYTRRIDEMVSLSTAEDLACLDIGGLHTGNTRPVRWLKQDPHTPLLRVTTCGGLIVSATADHPFWTQDGMVPLGRLRPNDQVAVALFQGVDYETPSTKVILSELDYRAYLARIEHPTRGKVIQQILAQVHERHLLPLQYDSPGIPTLCKIAGRIFGGGSLRIDRPDTGRIAFQGNLTDLEDIRRDIIKLGFRPGLIMERRRKHILRTTCGEHPFEQTDHRLTVNSTALAALLACLGAPTGNRATRDYPLPTWYQHAPRWQKRLFLAAFLGAQTSGAQIVSEHGTDFSAPTISIVKHPRLDHSGREFLRQVADWLGEFGVQTHPISSPSEQVDSDGKKFIRLKLVLHADPENLARLWSRIGFEYNRSRRTLAAAALLYLEHKRQHLQTCQMAVPGIASGESATHPNNCETKTGIVQTSQHEGGRTTSPAREGLPTFNEFRRDLPIGDSAYVWDRIASIEEISACQPVYDFSVDHQDHNFIAGGFVVSNCGVRLLASGLELEAARPHLDVLATRLNQVCPSGVGTGGVVQVSVPELDRVLRDGSRWAGKNGYASAQDLARTEEGGCLEGADPTKVSERAKKRGRDQIGSLGAGNHFIEVDVVEEIFDPVTAAVFGLREGCLVLQIHCGSRGLGHQVCTDYVQEFQGAVRRYGISLPDRELVCAPMDSPEGQAYLGAMRAAANFAFVNRQVLAHAARGAFEDIFAGKAGGWQLTQVYDIAHNIGKLEIHEVDGKQIKVCVHRKGATRAFGPGAPGLPPEYTQTGQPVLVPGSMGTSSWVLAGTEESMRRAWGSTCHGAGRVMSRAQAKHEIRGDSLRRELERLGIHVRAGSLPGLAEEAPAAYKDVEAVVETVTAAGLTRKVARLRPLAVIKG